MVGNFLGFILIGRPDMLGGSDSDPIDRCALNLNQTRFVLYDQFDIT